MLPYRADVTDEAAVQEIVETTEALETFDIPVNNAFPDYRFDPVTRKDSTRRQEALGDGRAYDLQSVG